MAAQFLSFNDAQQALLNDNPVFVDAEAVPLFSANQRILAQPIEATMDVPGYDNSGMDGYAICSADLRTCDTFKLIGKAFAGHPYTGEWQAGSCVRIMTGAQVPDGFDTVVMQEHAELIDSQDCQAVRFTQQIKHGQNVRKRGEDISQGQLLFAPGHRLKATDIGVLASLGFAQIQAYKPLKVAILSTGDELHEPGSQRSDSGIFDTNRYAVNAMLSNLGFDVLDMGIVADDPSALHQAFNDALAQADVVISSGGVSVGEADYTKDILNELGDMQFWKVAIKPGKPFAYGHFYSQNPQGQNKRFMGLPGNPVSSVVTLHQLALPALRKMAGENVQLPTPIYLPLAQSIAKKPGRLEFVRATVVTDQQTSKVQPLRGQGSGILSTFSTSQGYLMLDADGADWQAGDQVAFLPFDTALR